MKKNIFEGFAIKDVRNTDVQGYIAILDSVRDRMKEISGGCLDCASRSEKVDLVKFVDYSPKFNLEELKAVYIWFQAAGFSFEWQTDPILDLADSDETREVFHEEVWNKSEKMKESIRREKRKAELREQIASQQITLKANQEELSQLESIS